MTDPISREDALRRAVERARDRRVLIPTFAEMSDPSLMPPQVLGRLTETGLWDIDPVNLFRITWKNSPTARGGLFASVNFVELPSSLTRVDARIVALVGKWFPTGSHKVGAAFGCLAPKLVRGQFDPSRHRTVWPSTGNFCRGGAYNAALLGCESIAVLPEGMSRERFDWLSSIAGEVITTPGGESNVKEIFDRCRKLTQERRDVLVFNQFDEYGNHLWHYYVTGRAAAEVVTAMAGPRGRLAGFVSLSGSSGTLGAGDYLKERFPTSRIVVGEALQCPTLLRNGFGDHRIEGIGDKHVPWIHNVRNTDLVIAVDDEACLRLLRVFNEPTGLDMLASEGVDAEVIGRLELMGISGIGNLLCAVKFAKYFDLTSNDIVVTVLTDSSAMYGSRVREMREAHGECTAGDARADYYQFLAGQRTDTVLELDNESRRRIHNLKYYTWVEQQGKSVEELNRQWDEFPEFWDRLHETVAEIDRDIRCFNEMTGVLRSLPTRQ